MICLPEHFAYMSQKSYSQGSHLLKGFNEVIGGSLFNRYKQLALDNRVWLSLGSFPEASQNKPGSTYSTHVIVNEEGNIAATYRKLHMFDTDFLKEGVRRRHAESESVCPG